MVFSRYPLRSVHRLATTFGSYAMDVRTPAGRVHLLAVHPRPLKPAPAPKTTPEPGDLVTRPRPARIASGPAVASSTGHVSTLPIVAGILLLAFGLAAIAHAARDGRT